jgi:hypothetical protein
MYESLLKHSSEPFTLHVLALDERTAEAMQDCPGTEIYCRDSVEKELDLAEVKANRTWQEYCWTLASVFSEYILRRLTVHPDNAVTYLDADLMFFGDPRAIFDEIPYRALGSIAVIPHRFIPSKRHLEVNGRFNVSWVTFSGAQGYWCVQRWAEQCRKRCSANVGCGDQAYLDEWPGMFQDSLHVIQNVGAGLAPWNLANYQLSEGHAEGVPFVFFHAHEFIDGVQLTNYELRPQDIEFIYKPYLKAYQEAKEKIASIHLLAR